jgi:hypothetical protein
VKNLDGFTTLVWPPAVTVTFTVPAACAGADTVICVPVLFTVIPDETATDPNWTDVVPVNPAPLIVTLVPPRCDPELGETDVTTGP